jgi:hypothetical protein
MLAEEIVRSTDKSGYAHYRSAVFLVEESIVAILTGYFDESYSHPPQPLVYTVGGYISEDWRWRRFESEWASALDSEGIDFFHMKDFAHRKGVYAEWTEDKRRKFLRKLHHIIHSNTIKDFTNSVVVEDYDEVIPPSNVELRTSFGEPHVFAVIGCLKDVHDWAIHSKLKDRIHYVFEQGTVHDKNVGRLFARFDEEYKEHYRARGCSFFDKRDLNPLQAADILVYENMLEMRRRIDTSNNRAMRLSAKNLLRPSSNWGYYNREQMLKVVDKCLELGLLIEKEKQSDEN